MGSLGYQSAFFFTLLIADFAQSLAMLTLFGLQESFAQLHFGPNLGLKRLLGGSTKVTHTLQKSCGDPPSKTSVGTSLKKAINTSTIAAHVKYIENIYYNTVIL